MPLTVEEEERYRELMRECFEEFRSGFYIDPERHYNDHMWLKDIQCTMKDAHKTIRQVTLGTLILGLLTALWYGIINGGK